jgi:CRISPR/Cas system-associated exonuclease Cas4 (RecB family)
MAEYQKRYYPHRSAEWNYQGEKWKLSRSKIDQFLECPRCFYIDNKWGTKRPGMPTFNLNLAVDTLCKREFDYYRGRQEPHPIMQEYGIHAVPFSHQELESWRDPFVGIMHTEPTTGLVVSGGVDDIWQTNDTNELIVVDYKATSKESAITKLGDSPWEQQYARQVSVYRWLLEARGHAVSKTAYLVYANADAAKPMFQNTLHFRTTLIPIETNTDWILPTLQEIKTTLDANALPPIGANCEFCPYREAAGKQLLALHRSLHGTRD